MLIYVIVCCAQVQGAIICICMLICIYIYVIVFYFVFSTIFIGTGQNLTNLIAFWPYVCSVVYIIWNYSIHIKI